MVRRGVLSRVLFSVTGAATVMLALPARAHAQTPSPVVHVASETEATVFINRCSVPVTRSTEPGSVVVERDIVDQILTINFQVTGPAEPTTGTATFAAGAATTTVNLTPTAAADDTSIIHFTVTAGTGYAIGTPASADMQVSEPQITCPAPPTTVPPEPVPTTSPPTLARTGGSTTTTLIAAVVAIAVGALVLFGARKLRTPHRG
jgi:hypothetical protein